MFRILETHVLICLFLIQTPEWNEVSGFDCDEDGSKHVQESLGAYRTSAIIGEASGLFLNSVFWGWLSKPQNTGLSRLL